MHRNFGSGYPGDPSTKGWLEHHKHSVFGFPSLVRFSWDTCESYFKGGVEVLSIRCPITVFYARFNICQKIGTPF
ncbi:putative ribonuclease H [Helianthus annuus]|uniref:Ribonuclease H2 subunit A n=1 Tax=Helianthus annuus TaxID=4232 RepID=A0A9K3IWR3_HELAN|nr:putative ribonuclease H [Helianthus annuus]KAJ0575658.1 putative ribonuclease H [Helianthus annuus]KAJ0583532.1 putative ribonuclease H [Helianthus annuus]KAJ0630470.1 putative ribonuclease H [Helianthus annuus]KAJ0746262.1 putative ribonuclease H [Helianthus annuus]